MLKNCYALQKKEHNSFFLRFFLQFRTMIVAALPLQYFLHSVFFTLY
jgi:hypothetical protein